MRDSEHILHIWVYFGATDPVGSIIDLQGTVVPDFMPSVVALSHETRKGINVLILFHRLSTLDRPYLDISIYMTVHVYAIYLNNVVLCTPQHFHESKYVDKVTTGPIHILYRGFTVSYAGSLRLFTWEDRCINSNTVESQSMHRRRHDLWLITLCSRRFAEH